MIRKLLNAVHKRNVSERNVPILPHTYTIHIDPLFYVYQENPLGVSGKAKKYFSLFGAFYDQIYKVSKKIVKRQFWTDDQLKEAYLMVQGLNQHNCDFRIYQMKDAIEHALYCEIMNRDIEWPPKLWNCELRKELVIHE